MPTSFPGSMVSVTSLEDEGERMPSYYRFPFELFIATEDLPQAQRAKCRDAALEIFFKGEEPAGLPVPVRHVLAGWRSRILAARQKSDERLAQGQDTKNPKHSIQKPEQDCLKNVISSEQNRDGNSTRSNIVTCENDSNHFEVASQGLYAENEIKERGKGNLSPSELTRARVSGIPTLEEVKKFFLAEGLTVSPERFYTYNEARGWVTKAGKRIDDWRGLARAWNKRERNLVSSVAKPGTSVSSSSHAQSLPSAEEFAQRFGCTQSEAQASLQDDLF